MKLNLNIKVVLGGQVNVIKTSARVRDEKRYSEECNSIVNFEGVTADITINESVEDITPKEYIQAIGAAIKDIFQGAMSAKFDSPPMAKKAEDEDAERCSYEPVVDKFVKE